MAKGKLNDRQELFCQEYLIDLNSSQAALRAGYSEKTHRQIGSENLTNLDIRSRIKELMKIRSDNFLIDGGFVVESLVDNIRRCRQEKPVMIWGGPENGMVESGEYEFDSAGANRALELLGKHLGLFEKDNKQKVPEINFNTLSTEDLLILSKMQRKIEGE